MKKITIFILFTSVFVFSQKVDSIESIKNIRTQVTDFLVEKGDLKFKEKDSINRYSIIEILQKKVLGYNKNGIYKIYAYNSHSTSYLLIKESKDTKILELNNLSTLLSDILKYSKANNLSDEEISIYIEKVLLMYRNNTNKEKEYKLSTRKEK